MEAEYRGLHKIDTLLAKGNEIKEQYPDSAIELMKEALAAGREHDDEAGYTKVLEVLSGTYIKSGIAPDSCIAFFSGIKNKSPQEAVIVNLTLAKAYAEKNELEKALAYGMRSLGLIDNITPPDSALLLDALMNMGVFNLRLGDYDAGLEYFNKAEQLAWAHKDTMAVRAIDLSKGGLYLNKGDFHKAATYFRKALEIQLKQHDSAGIKQSLMYLGNCYAGQGRSEEAMAYLMRAADIHITGPLAINIDLTLYWAIADLFKKEGDFKQAEENFRKALQLAYQATRTDYRLTALLQDLADLYYTEGMYKQAYEVHKSGIEKFVERINEEAAASYTALATKYQLSEKNKTIATKETEIARQKERIHQQYFLLVIFTLSFVIIVLLVLYLTINRRNKAKLSLIKGKMEGIEQERERLSRELHDGIISELSGISYKLKAIASGYPGGAQAAGSEVADVLNSLQDSISSLRNTSHNLLPDIISRLGLVPATRIFCKKLDHPGFRITVLDYGELPEVTYDFQLTVYRILQEAITNIAKHTDAKNVLVQFNIIQQQLHITIEDDNTGNNPVAEMDWGAGMINMQTRLRTVGGNMETRVIEEGTCLYFDIDFGKFIIIRPDED